MFYFLSANVQFGFDPCYFAILLSLVLLLFISCIIIFYFTFRFYCIRIFFSRCPSEFPLQNVQSIRPIIIFFNCISLSLTVMAGTSFVFILQQSTRFITITVISVMNIIRCAFKARPTPAT